MLTGAKPCPVRSSNSFWCSVAERPWYAENAGPAALTKIAAYRTALPTRYTSTLSGRYPLPLTQVSHSAW